MTGSAAVLLVAMLLDAVLGEPAWLWSRLPHPAVLMGRVIGWCDRQFNTGTGKRLRGAAVVTALVLAAGALGIAIEGLAPVPVLDCILVAILLAQRSLAQHVAAVATALRESLSRGRAEVAMIVGRDTEDMDEAAVSRAAIESAAENLSDGVIAPAFWYLLAGLPGILIYKMVNTADSMVGHRTPRHEEFGWAAARFDDLLNWLPARLTALLILASHGRLAQWNATARDAPLHRSPNAGWPEAAMARCLGVALSGPRSYAGEMRGFPFINSEGERAPTAATIDRAVAALWRSWAAMVLITLPLLTL